MSPNFCSHLQLIVLGVVKEVELPPEKPREIEINDKKGYATYGSVRFPDGTIVSEFRENNANFWYIGDTENPDIIAEYVDRKDYIIAGEKPSILIGGILFSTELYYSDKIKSHQKSIITQLKFESLERRIKEVKDEMTEKLIKHGFKIKDSDFNLYIVSKLI